MGVVVNCAVECENRFPKEEAVTVVATVLAERDRNLEVWFSLHDPENHRLYESHPTFRS